MNILASQNWCIPFIHIAKQTHWKIIAVSISRCTRCISIRI